MYKYVKLDIAVIPQSILTDVEKKATISTAVEQDAILYKVHHGGSFKRLQRIIGYIFRFMNNTRIPKHKRNSHISLTPKELDESLYVIIRRVQRSDFYDEIKQLQKSHEVDKRSCINALSPYLDSKGIIRVGGRLGNSDLHEDVKQPMVLPYNDPITKLLFISLHEENKHCGHQALLNTVRQRFWPVKGKITARSVVQKCVRCTRAKPQLCQQIMGDLPQTRVVPARPFINSGVDYCDPFWIHHRVRGKRPTKAYISVFCCFATKAVHLELVFDLSTSAFIGALKRFIARRGHCQNIYSDNATNFVGAKNQLSELAEAIYSSEAQENIMTAASSKGIKFNFIPPRAPHFGGLWEAAVKSAKHLLVRSMGTASLTYEEFETVIVEVEAILNSRPLTPMSSDPSDLTALTPGHFLIGEPLTTPIDSEADSRKISLLSRWELVSRLKFEFWKQWSKEYLQELQLRHKWKKSSPNLKPGNMVIIQEDNTPPLKWPLGRITNVFPGNDGIVRVAEVKTATGIFKRPIHRLALLPIENTASCVDEDIETEPERKKTRLHGNHLVLTLLAMFLILPIVSSTHLNISRFESKLGVHFEEVGRTKIATSQWNLIVYYDLSMYWKDTKLLRDETLSLQKTCDMMEIKESCRHILENFFRIEQELELENKLLRKSRIIRGAINIIGNIANSLFGILDSEYAEQMSATIKNMKTDDSVMLRLLRDQTSVINSTLNVVKQSMTTTKHNFGQMEKKLNGINSIHIWPNYHP
ncbi:uncharacterized protein LOC142239762 [Haematobia irritans]|uniref:uncharacterized protein LOC142239762 n=1 Tax=Haematobia irritans TaxID=7368 RepID=UPI003F4FA78C